MEAIPADDAIEQGIIFYVSVLANCLKQGSVLSSGTATGLLGVVVACGAMVLCADSWFRMHHLAEPTRVRLVACVVASSFDHGCVTCSHALCSMETWRSRRVHLLFVFVCLRQAS